MYHEHEQWTEFTAAIKDRKGKQLLVIRFPPQDEGDREKLGRLLDWLRLRGDFKDRDCREFISSKIGREIGVPEWCAVLFDDYSRIN
jgi:hypothetical protein